MSNRTKYLLIALGIVVVIGSVALLKKPREKKVGARLVVAEKTLYTTTTNANYAGVPFMNVHDFEMIAVTVQSTVASGTVRVACSTQDDEPTNAATSTSNLWDWVDTIDVETETSVDGETGYAMANTTGIRRVVVRNSIFKWCTVRISGNTSNPGLGTSTVYMKPVQLGQ